MNRNKTDLLSINQESRFFCFSVQNVIVADIPDGCESRNKAFANCLNLIYIRIPAGVQIADDAFEGCSDSLIIDQ